MTHRTWDWSLVGPRGATTVWDRYGKDWKASGAYWTSKGSYWTPEGGISSSMPWSQLVRDHGPLTTKPPEPNADCSTTLKDCVGIDAPPTEGRVCQMVRASEEHLRNIFENLLVRLTKRVEKLERAATPATLTPEGVRAIVRSEFKDLADIISDPPF